MNSFINFLRQTLIHTPWWVYGLLIYLIFIGIKASRPRIISIKRLIVIPAIFTILSVHTLLTSVTPDSFNISCWIAAILIGAILGWLDIQRKSLLVDKRRALIQLPGTWSTLILVLIIFVTKYYFGYQLAVDPKLVVDTAFEVSMLFVSGICTGLFIGRFICYVYRIQVEPQSDLKLSS